MKDRELARFRLWSQGIAEPRGSGAGELLSYMGPLQAQDFEMATWAVGLRLGAKNRSEVGTAIDRGEILRTHLLRPTWHFVAAADIRWILGLTAPRIRGSLGSRHRQLGLDAKLLSRCLDILEGALSGGKQGSRGELVALLEKAGIPTDENRASHIFLVAELEGLVCSGMDRGREPRYALLRDRAPEAARLDREESLGALARRYFAGRGPAALEDFVWWSGLGRNDARRSIELNGNGLERLDVEGREYWMLSSQQKPVGRGKIVRLLPAFDEFLIAYADRRASVSRELHAKAVSSNGIFRPIIVVDGKVTGIWKRTVGTKEVEVSYDFFEPPTPAVLGLLEREAERYRNFCES